MNNEGNDPVKLLKEQNAQLQEQVEKLQEKVKQLEDDNKRLIDGNEQLIARNMMLAEKMDIYYNVRMHVEWLKDLVRRHREMMAQADLRSDEELLAVIETRIESDEIPLPPEFGIKEVAELVGTTQTRIADLYKSKTIYQSVYKYLDFLRLMRALRILKEKPGYSIDAIAQDSGFNSVRTLQRKIQEAIGLSPGQYRDITNPE